MKTDFKTTLKLDCQKERTLNLWQKEPTIGYNNIMLFFHIEQLVFFIA